MVTVTGPSSVTPGAGAVSHGRKRSGTSSPGSEVHSQQMNLALLSSGLGWARAAAARRRRVPWRL